MTASILSTKSIYLIQQYSDELSHERLRYIGAYNE